MNSKLKIIILIATLVLLIGWSVVLYFIDVVELVDYVGVTNGYVITFLTALLGGFSLVTSTVFIFALYTFILGGLNPIILALISALALTIVDTGIAVLVSHGSTLIKNYESTKIGKMSQWLLSKPKKVVGLIIILYFAFTPFPNEIMVVTLALGRYKLKNYFWSMFIGNILFTLVIALTIFYTGNILFTTK